MKVSASSSLVSSSAPKGAPAAASGTFSLGGAASTAPATQASAAAGVSSVQALIALQEVGGPLERRRRAVSRAGRILDVLDEMKLALLGDNLSTATLDRLTRAVRDQREATDDPALESLLNEIEMRAAVEMAKLEHAKVAA
jgi:hypothetical protein